MRIPADTLPSVQPQASPTPGENIQASPADFGAQVGGAEQEQGAVLGQAGDRLQQNAMAFQGLRNETMAKEADNAATSQAINLMYNPRDGYLTKQGKDAADGYQGAFDQLQQLRQSTLSGLENDQQRQMFDTVFQRTLRMVETTAASHADQQNKLWQLGASDARAQTQINLASSYYNNDAVFKTSLATAKGEALSQGEIQGWSPSQVQAKQQQYTSAAWSARIERTAVDDPVAAQTMFRQNFDQLEAPAQTELSSRLKAMVMPQQSRSTALSIMSGGSAPADPDALFAAQQKIESTDQVGAVGPVTRSGASALGLMQVMPDTAREVAAKLGVPYQPELMTAKTPEAAQYQQMLGQEYMKEQLANYSGNQTLALAAYNAGPGVANKWIAQFGDPRTGAISDADFVNSIPANYQETKDYINKINALAPPKPGTMPTSMDVRTHMPQWLAQADAAASATRPGDAVYRDMVRGQILDQGRQIEMGSAQQEKNARDTLLTGALGLSKGTDGNFTQVSTAQRPTSLEQLLSTPDMKNAWATSDPIAQRGILELLDHNAKGTSPPVTDEALSKYYQLKGEAARDPVAFGSERLDDPSLLSVLPHNLSLDLMNTQAALTTRQARDAAKGENMLHAAAVAKPMLMAAGIAIPTKPGVAAPVYDQFLGRFSEALDNFQQQNKHTASDQDIRQIAGSLLAVGSQAGTAGWFHGNKTVKAFEVDPDKFEPNIPGGTRQNIIGAFQKLNGRVPTNEELMHWYTRGQQGAQ